MREHPAGKKVERMQVIETHGLAKAYRGRRVVDGFDMRVAAGDIYGFVGRNGAGKSTVMRMIDGLAAPTAGTISLFGRDVAEGGDGERARIGALINEPGLLLDMSVHGNMMAKALAIGVADAKGRTDELLRLVGLTEASRKRAKKLSQGMKQRLGIAMALLGSPDLLLLDEPFNGLDPEATREMRNLIMRLNDLFGMTVVVSSHVLDQLDRMATRYGVIANGHMVREMTADEVRAECGESLTARTTDPERTLALLEERFPQVAFTMLPDKAIQVSGAFDAAAVAEVLRASGTTVLELTENQRDIEDYFVELMEGGERRA